MRKQPLLSLVVLSFFTLAAGILLFAQETPPKVFIVGQNENDVIMRAALFFRGSSVIDGLIPLDEHSNVHYKEYFTKHDREAVYFYFFNNKLLQIEIVPVQYSKPAVRKDYLNPTTTSAYPFAYVFNQTGGTISVEHAHSRQELDSLLQATAKR